MLQLLRNGDEAKEGQKQRRMSEIERKREEERGRKGRCQAQIKYDESPLTEASLNRH